MKNSKQITTKKVILTHLKSISSLKQEHFVCLSLDSAYRLIAKRTVFIGTLTSCPVHPREVFAAPITDRAMAIIVAHNHPSGDVLPSSADIDVTQQLVAAGQLLGIGIEDHIIVGGDKHFSFVEHGLIEAGASKAHG